MDWNLVIRVLDELRDGPRPLIEFANSLPHYDGDTSAKTAIYLSSRSLIKLSTTEYPFAPIPQTEWEDWLRKAFSDRQPDLAASVSTSIELDERGQQILKLLGIG